MYTKEMILKNFESFIYKDSLPYFSYEHNTDGIFTHVSENITALLGFNIQEFKTSYTAHLTANPINKDVIKHTLRAIDGVQQDPYKLEIYDKNLNTHLLNVYEKPIFEGEKVISIQGIAKLLS